MNLPDFDHLAPSRDEQFCSVGFLCQLFQCLPSQLKVLMEETGTRFARVVDGIGFMRVEDAEKVAAKLVEVRKEISELETSHQRN